ncbi:MAG: hypothetical protein HY912_08060 [Desulfomonile tiedjei]|uniref:Uncharacterized protein n=1 Tax=Desulfomonile tiedjei TaxID=2358 RepID=A0A9D6Z328_9BACT|nr:hypothetical protein [Desulfomonile tiedjei]
MNLTLADFTIIAVLLGVIQFLASTWVKSRLESSIKHEYEKTLDILRKRRDTRVTYLIEAYRRLESAANRPLTETTARNVESALADMQLFGTPRQVELAQQCIEYFAKHQGVEMNSLLADLRKDLRSELDLQSVDGPLAHICIHLHDSTQQNPSPEGKRRKDPPRR